MQALSNYLLDELSGLYCIRHRKNANVFINDEGFITYTACCDDFHKNLYEAQDILKQQYSSVKEEDR